MIYRPRLPRPAVVWAITRRDYLVLRSYRLAVGFDLFSGAIGLIVYYYISRTFVDASARDFGGAPDYFAFAVVGVTITAVIYSVTIGLARRVREEQLTGTLEALVAHPVTPTELALGLTGYPFLFASFRVAAYLLLANVIFGVDFSHADWVGAALAFLATAAAISSLGVCIGALVLVVKRAEAVAGLVVHSLAVLGGAFFPVAVLPDWVEPVANVVPTQLAFASIRSALFVGDDWLRDTVALAVIAAIVLPLGMWLFSRTLSFTKRRGTLTEY